MFTVKVLATVALLGLLGWVTRWSLRWSWLLWVAARLTVASLLTAVRITLGTVAWRLLSGCLLGWLAIWARLWAIWLLGWLAVWAGLWAVWLLGWLAIGARLWAVWLLRWLAIRALLWAVWLLRGLAIGALLWAILLLRWLAVRAGLRSTVAGLTTWVSRWSWSIARSRSIAGLWSAVAVRTSWQRPSELVIPVDLDPVFAKAGDEVRELDLLIILQRNLLDHILELLLETGQSVGVGALGLVGFAVDALLDTRNSTFAL